VVDDILKVITPEKNDLSRQDHFKEATIVIGNNGKLVGEFFSALIATVEEIAFNIEEGVSPPLSIELAALSEIRRRLIVLESKKNLSLEERQERIALKSRVKGLADAERELIRGVSVLIGEPALRIYYTSSKDIAECVKGFLDIFSEPPTMSVTGSFTKFDLYRARYPKLATAVFLDNNELTEVMQVTGVRSVNAFMIRMGYFASDLPKKIFIRKALPRIIYEIIQVEDKIDKSKIRENLFDLSHWFLGLG